MQLERVVPAAIMEALQTHWDWQGGMDRIELEEESTHSSLSAS